jgi:hypothetical protein
MHKFRKQLSSQLGHQNTTERAKLKEAFSYHFEFLVLTIDGSNDRRRDLFRAVDLHNCAQSIYVRKPFDKRVWAVVGLALYELYI